MYDLRANQRRLEMDENQKRTARQLEEMGLLRPDASRLELYDAILHLTQRHKHNTEMLALYMLEIERANGALERMKDHTGYLEMQM